MSDGGGWEGGDVHFSLCVSMCGALQMAFFRGQAKDYSWEPRTPRYPRVDSQEAPEGRSVPV